MPIDRTPLREQVKEEVLRLIDSGELTAGKAINEVQLSNRIGVSRTPLREALITLEHEGIIRSTSGKGFSFSPLSQKEFTELCPVLADLEMLALELSDPAAVRDIAHQLVAKAREFTVQQASAGLIERQDDEWHGLLLSACPNERLLQLIASLKQGLRRYERLMFGDDTILERSADEHERIAQCLIDDDLPGALRALKQNWHSGMTRILEQMNADDEPSAASSSPLDTGGAARWWRKQG